MFYAGLLLVSFDDGWLVGPVIDLLKRSAPVALLAVGRTLVIDTRGIDLSVCTVLAICSAVAAFGVPEGSWHPLSLLARVAAGLWNGALVAVAWV